jgi:hypothetical protein
METVKIEVGTTLIHSFNVGFVDDKDDISGV